MEKKEIETKKPTEKNISIKEGIIFSTIVVFVKTIIVVSPTIILFSIVYFVHKNWVKLNSHWASFWGYFSVFSMFLSNIYSLNLLYSNGHKITEEVITPSLYTGFLITLPLICIWVISIGYYYYQEDLKELREKNLVVAYTKLNNFPIILTLLAYPLAFIALGFYVKKVNWVCSGLVYSIPFVSMYFCTISPFLILSAIILFIISLIHACTIRGEYTIKSDKSNIVEIC